ncbi:MAG: hypothetical protein CMM50_11265 [Rhodospirillaceae bacterium]|nr:hypothetical protein [Rhodospirillaceae bacterium]|tara:strand:- start:422 stop:991 length:570 start_codon:yes stop_codon:yes gene_type:complete
MIGRAPLREWDRSLKRAGLGAILVAGLATGTLADEKGVPGVDEVQSYIEKGSPACRQEASDRCISLWWGFIDRDGDGYASASELGAFRQGLDAWLDKGAEILTLRGKASLTSGLWLFDRIGPERIVKWYDADGDGRLSRDELLADINLDTRPLADVLADPKGIDQSAIRDRFGFFTATALRIVRWMATR